jgi:methylthioadenosine nucleosidase (EC 3.2.2.16)
MIGIIGAMEEEVKIIREEMEGKQTVEVAGCRFYRGKLRGEDAVLVLSGIGKVNAALASAIVMERFHPDALINIGSAGGVDPSRNIGDLVIATRVCHHDMDVTAFGYAYGQVPKMPLFFPCDPGLIESAGKAAARLGLSTVPGLVASGDTFMNDPERVEFLKRQFPGLLAVEMEGAAIAQVAHQYGTPFIIIRSLSDIAGKQSDIRFEEFLPLAARNSAQLVLNMVEQWEKTA